MTEILVVLWQWGPNNKYAGSRFWAAHSTNIDGRIADWPQEDLIPLGAATASEQRAKGLSFWPQFQNARAPSAYPRKNDGRLTDDGDGAIDCGR